MVFPFLSLSLSLSLSIFLSLIPFFYSRAPFGNRKAEERTVDRDEKKNCLPDDKIYGGAIVRLVNERY